METRPAFHIVLSKLEAESLRDEIVKIGALAEIGKIGDLDTRRHRLGMLIRFGLSIYVAPRAARSNVFLKPDVAKRIRNQAVNAMGELTDMEFPTLTGFCSMLDNVDRFGTGVGNWYMEKHDGRTTAAKEWELGWNSNR